MFRIQQFAFERIIECVRASEPREVDGEWLRVIEQHPTIFEPYANATDATMSLEEKEV
ncbi:hypothetical protein LZC95_43270 [Pendulispora brunnea]|uniref:Uncharacterized protein n=1 Tax=Pendulispora brunnea TaxID=2905690 RepID=A0ABZ2K7M6_9BACT